MADQLCTAAQVKARVEVTDANDDVLIGELIDQVSDWIQDYTGRRFVAIAGATYIADTAGGGVIEVPIGVRNVTALAIAATDQPDAGGAWTAVAAADILLRPSSIARRPGWPATQILIRNASIGRLTATLGGAQITGDFGFAAVPPLIQAIAIDAAATAFTSRMAGDSDAVGPDRSPVAVWARLFAEGTEQRATLARYRAGYNMGIS